MFSGGIEREQWHEMTQWHSFEVKFLNNTKRNVRFFMS